MLDFLDELDKLDRLDDRTGDGKEREGKRFGFCLIFIKINQLIQLFWSTVESEGQVRYVTHAGTAPSLPSPVQPRTKLRF